MSLIYVHMILLLLLCHKWVSMFSKRKFEIKMILNASFKLKLPVLVEQFTNVLDVAGISCGAS